jgi:hypothetical protein
LFAAGFDVRPVLEAGGSISERPNANQCQMGSSRWRCERSLHASAGMYARR